MYYVPQLGTSDCGVACLKMLLAHLNKDRRYLFMPCDENHGNYSYKDLTDIAKSNGVTLNGFKVEDKEEIIKCNLPAIVRIITKEEKHHAVLVTKVTKRKIYLMDPHVGEVTMKLADFYSKWDSTGLFVSEFNRCPYPFDKIEPLSNKHKITSYALQIISGICFAAGLYFINPNGPYVLPVVLIGLGLVLELVLRIYQYKLMSVVDNYFLQNYDIVPSKSYFDYYIRCQEFKKEYLTNGLNVIYSSLVSIFVIAITIFNSQYNLPLVVAPILLAATECLIYSKRENQTLQKLSDEESQLKGNKNKDDMLLKVKSMQKHAYDFSKNKLATKYIGILVFFLTSILVSVITDSFTLIDLIFSICIQIFLYQNLVPVFEEEKREEKLCVAKSKISNIFYNSIHLKDEI